MVKFRNFMICVVKRIENTLHYLILESDDLPVGIEDGSRIRMYNDFIDIFLKAILTERKRVY